MQHTDTITADIAIVGAGPIGIELAVCLKAAGMDYVHLEARQIGHTMSWWPRDTTFFSTTERIEIAGVPLQSTAQGRTTGEEYLAYLRSIVEQFDLQVNTYEPVTGIERTEDGFLLQTQPQTGPRAYVARNVVLASGDMHRPHRLQIPGEDLPHVSHYFRDVHPYFRRRLLIVGGRNSAAEAALRCWRAGAQVALSYRRATFDQRLVKHWILPDLQAQIDNGMIGFHPLTAPLEITPGHVVLAQRLRTPICLDESILSAAGAADAIDRGACSIVNIKAGRVGGYLEAVRVHDACVERDVPVWCGGMVETGLGRAANVALAALPGFTLPGDTSGSDRFFTTDLTEPLVLRDGGLDVPTASGLGVTPIPELLERFTTHTEWLHHG